MESWREMIREEIQRQVGYKISGLDHAEKNGFRSYSYCMDEILFMSKPDGGSVYLPPYVNKKLKELGFYTTHWGGSLLTEGRYYITISRSPITIFQRLKNLLFRR
jgi:hypothetical protein